MALDPFASLTNYGNAVRAELVKLGVTQDEADEIGYAYFNFGEGYERYLEPKDEARAALREWRI